MHDFFLHRQVSNLADSIRPPKSKTPSHHLFSFHDDTAACFSSTGIAGIGPSKLCVWSLCVCICIFLSVDLFRRSELGEGLCTYMGGFFKSAFLRESDRPELTLSSWQAVQILLLTDTLFAEMIISRVRRRSPKWLPVPFEPLPEGQTRLTSLSVLDENLQKWQGLLVFHHTVCSPATHQLPFRRL